eukprot:43183_1
MGSQSSSASQSNSLTSASGTSSEVVIKTKEQLIEKLRDLRDIDILMTRIHFGRYSLQHNQTRQKKNQVWSSIGLAASKLLLDSQSSKLRVNVITPRQSRLLHPVIVIPIMVGAGIAGLLYCGDKVYDDIAWHEYIVIEYGLRLEIPLNGFAYSRFVRIDFGSDGYAYCEDKTINYWKTFENERKDHRGTLHNSAHCIEHIDKLIDIVENHNPKYNVAINNCKHFSAEIWIKMALSDAALDMCIYGLSRIHQSKITQEIATLISLYYCLVVIERTDDRNDI